ASDRRTRTRAHAGADRAAHPATARSAARLRADRARVVRRRDGSRPLRRVPGSEVRRCYYSPPSRKPRASEVHMARAGEVDSSRREFVQSAASLAALAAAPVALSAAGGSEADKAAVLAQIPAMHEVNVKRLQDWIALPSIAAENRNYPQGAEYMAKLAREAGFAGVKLIPTSGKPGVFGKLDAGARTTVGMYFMYDVKQFEPSEWSSPPLEARLVRREGLGTVCMGRGAVNQKGPENSFLSALLAFKAAGRKLPVNLVLVCEGEEEIASPHFQELIMTPEVLAELHKCSGVFMPEAGQDRDGGVLVSLGAKGVVERWVHDSSWVDSLLRLESQPTINIEGLVGGYTGPGGKTVLPHRAVAKIDMRLVPDMTASDTLAKLKAHLAKRGFADIEVNMSGGYNPTQTDPDSRLIRAQLATYRKLGHDPQPWPRGAGSWPGYVFTDPPLSLPAGHFGLGHGTGAHAPDEYYLIESDNPRVLGLEGAVAS